MTKKNSGGQGKSGKKSPVRCKVCGKDTIIEFAGDGVQYPVFSCIEHGVQRNDWEKWWNEYSDRWKDKKYWNKSPQDNLSCLIGYFCHKFKEFYGYPFTFSVSSPIPYTNKDFTMGRRILAMFDGDITDALVYIKWVFVKKVKTRKKPITSLGFFTLTDFINEFKYAKAMKKILKRHTPLPADYLVWCRENCSDIFEKHGFKTWNDLNALVLFIRSFGADGVEGKVVGEAVVRKMLIVKDGIVQLKILED